MANSDEQSSIVTVLDVISSVNYPNKQQNFSECNLFFLGLRLGLSIANIKKNRKHKDNLIKMYKIYALAVIKTLRNYV